MRLWVWLTCGRQSGRDSKMTSRTPMGTVICSSSRLLATLVLLSTRPTLSLEATASWRRPMARLFSLAVDRLRRLIKAWEKSPRRKHNEQKKVLLTENAIVMYRYNLFAFSRQRHCKTRVKSLSKSRCYKCAIWVRGRCSSVCAL